jgi:hypothetical protein
MPPQGVQRPTARQIQATAKRLGLTNERQQQVQDLLRDQLALAKTDHEKGLLSRMLAEVLRDENSPLITEVLELQKASEQEVRQRTSPAGTIDPSSDAAVSRRRLEEEQAHAARIQAEHRARMYGQPARTEGLLGQWGDPAQHPVVAPVLNLALNPIPWVQRRATDLADLFQPGPGDPSTAETPESPATYKGRPIDARTGILGYGTQDEDLLGTYLNHVGQQGLWPSLLEAGGVAFGGMPTVIGQFLSQPVGEIREDLARTTELLGDMPSALDVLGLVGTGRRPAAALLRRLEDAGADLGRKSAAAQRQAARQATDSGAAAVVDQVEDAITPSVRPNEVDQVSVDKVDQVPVAQPNQPGPGTRAARAERRERAAQQQSTQRLNEIDEQLLDPNLTAAQQATLQAEQEALQRNIDQITARQERHRVPTSKDVTDSVTPAVRVNEVDAAKAVDEIPVDGDEVIDPTPSQQRTQRPTAEQQVQTTIARDQQAEQARLERNRRGRVLTGEDYPVVPVKGAAPPPLPKDPVRGGDLDEFVIEEGARLTDAELAQALDDPALDEFVDQLLPSETLGDAGAAVNQTPRPTPTTSPPPPFKQEGKRAPLTEQGEDFAAFEEAEQARLKFFAALQHPKYAPHFKEALEAGGLSAEQADDVLTKAIQGDPYTRQELKEGGRYRDALQTAIARGRAPQRAVSTPPPDSSPDLSAVDAVPVEGADQTPATAVPSASTQPPETLGDDFFKGPGVRSRRKSLLDTWSKEDRTGQGAGIKQWRAATAANDSPARRAAREEIATRLQRETQRQERTLATGTLEQPTVTDAEGLQRAGTDPQTGEKSVLGEQQGAGADPQSPEQIAANIENAQELLKADELLQQDIENAVEVTGNVLTSGKGHEAATAGGLPKLERIVDAPGTQTLEVSDQWKQELQKLFPNEDEYNETIALIETVATRMRAGQEMEAMREIQRYYKRIMKSVRGPRTGRGARADRHRQGRVTPVERTPREIASLWTAGGGEGTGPRRLLGSMKADPAGVSNAVREAEETLFAALQRVRAPEVPGVPGTAPGRPSAAYSLEDTRAILDEFIQVNDKGVPRHPAYAQFVNMTWLRNKLVESQAALQTAFPSQVIESGGMHTLMQNMDALYRASVNEIQNFANAVATSQTPGKWRRTSVAGRAPERVQGTVRGEGASGLYGDADELRPNMEFQLSAAPSRVGGVVTVDPLKFAPKALDDRMRQYMEEGVALMEQAGEASAAGMGAIVLGLIGSAVGGTLGAAQADVQGLTGGARLANIAAGTVLGGGSAAATIPFSRNLWTKNMRPAEKVRALFMNNILQRPRTLWKMVQGANSGALAAGIETATEGFLDKWVLGNVARGTKIMERGQGIIGDVVAENLRALRGSPASLFHRNLGMDLTTDAGKRQAQDYMNSLLEATGGTPVDFIGGEATGKMGRLTHSLVGRIARAGDWAAQHILIRHGIPPEAARNYTLTGHLRTQTGQHAYDTLGAKFETAQGRKWMGQKGSQAFRDWMQVAKVPFSAVPRIGLQTAEMGLERMVAPFAQLIDPQVQKLFPADSRLSALGMPGRAFRDAGMFALDEAGNPNYAKLMTRVLGTGAAGGAGWVGHEHLDPKLQPLALAAAGPWALPALTGAAANQARIAGTSFLSELAERLHRQISPMPTGQMPWEDPAQAITQLLIPGVAQDARRMLYPDPEGASLTRSSIARALATDEAFADSPAGRIMQRTPASIRRPAAELLTSLPGLGPKFYNLFPPRNQYNRNLFGREAYDPDRLQAWFPGPGGWQGLTTEPTGTYEEMLQGVSGQPPQTEFWPQIGKNLRQAAVRTLFPGNPFMQPQPPVGIDKVLQAATSFQLPGEPGAGKPTPGVPAATWRPVTGGAPVDTSRAADPLRQGLPMQGVTRRGKQLIAENIVGQQNLDQYKYLQWMLDNNMWGGVPPAQRRRNFLNRAAGIGSRYPVTQAARDWTRLPPR